MAALRLFILSIVILGTEGALFTHQKKDFRRNTLKKVEFGSDRESLYRMKRATSSVGEVSHTDVTLNGTEEHSQAFVHWSGKDKSEAVFILTLQYNSTSVTDSQTWRSLDYGKTYNMVNFTKEALITFFYVSPADHRKMVFTDVKNKLIYTSSDELNTTQTYLLPAASDDISMHPQQPETMLLFDWPRRQVFVTTDFGKSWNLLQKNVNPWHIFWGLKGYDSMETVHLEVQPLDSENAYYKKCTIPYCNGTSDQIDLQLGPFMPSSMVVANEFIFVQKTDWDGTNAHVMVSHNRSEFNYAFFPANVKTKDFLLVNADEGQVFMAVSHGDSSGASLFLSDPTGRYYTLCLEKIHHRATRNWFEIDLHEVKGLRGTYLANQLDDNAPGAQGRRLKTLITVDSGGNWQPLTTSCPDNDKGCNLLLRLDLDAFSVDWILSEEKAPGIVIAHGHYGETYEHDLKNMSVFVSRDGARTWLKTHLTGLYHFRILDQGGIITAIQNGDQGPTNEVNYSYDDGQTWSLATFGDKTLKVDGVLNEPGINTLLVSVYGHASHGVSPWIMVMLNFSQVLSTKCSADQYETWTPADHDQNFHEVCILGQRMAYKRRKPSAICFNGEDFQRHIENSTCLCQDEDFECDFGYIRDKQKTPQCQKEKWYHEGYLALECEAGQPVQKSQGYRKVASDKCTNGIEKTDPYRKKTASCPLVAPSQLILVSNITVVKTGEPVLLHLSQKLGHKAHTKYTWNFSDSHTFNATGLKNASLQIHSFAHPNLYNISVTARNGKGSSTSNILSLRVEDPIHKVGVYAAWAAKVGFPVTVKAQSNVVPPNSFDTLHYTWRFGDETGEEKGALSWKPYSNHTYSKAGTYTVTLTAVNAVSALSKQVKIKVFDDNAVVVQLNFSANINKLVAYITASPAAQASFLDSLRQELSLRAGIDLDRLCVTLNSSRPVRTDVLVVPPPTGSSDNSRSVKEIVNTLVDMVGNKTLFLYRSVSARLGDIQVTGIRVFHSAGGGKGGGGGGGNGKEGPNYRAVYITVPIVILAAIVTGLVLLYYRKRFRNMRRYSLVNQHEDTDALLSDDDDPPLDLRSPNRDEARSRDDPMLDLGTGSHLVMVTGSSGGDSAENC